MFSFEELCFLTFSLSHSSLAMCFYSTLCQLIDTHAPDTVHFLPDHLWAPWCTLFTEKFSGCLVQSCFAHLLSKEQIFSEKKFLNPLLLNDSTPPCVSFLGLPESLNFKSATAGKSYLSFLPLLFLNSTCSSALWLKINSSKPSAM